MSIIKSFSVDKGDTYYIKHNSNNFTIIDCNLLDDRKDEIVSEFRRESREKAVVRFISTHPDDDHIHGISYLFDHLDIPNFYCVANKVHKDPNTDSFERYEELRDSPKAFYLNKGCKRCWMNEDDEDKQYGSAGINILWPITSNEEFKKALDEAEKSGQPNNISPIVSYSAANSVEVIWMGDLKNDFMNKIEDRISLNPVDVLFAPHHGRKTGRPPKSWMDSMNPGLVIIGEADSKDLEYYQDYVHLCQNTAGDILLDCVNDYVHIYVSNPYDVKGLLNLKVADYEGLSYIGSLATKER